MKKQHYIFVIFVFYLNSGFCEHILNNKELQNNQTSILQNQLDELNKKFSALQAFDEKSFNEAISLSDKAAALSENSAAGIANKISIMSLWLQVFGIIFVILGAGIGFYVKYIYNKVRKAKNKAEQIKNEITDFVNKNNDTLYQKLIEMDTEKMIEQISVNHREVHNVVTTLSFRTITGEKNFQGLLKAYQAAEIDISPDLSEFQLTPLLSLIYQHYPQKITSHIDLFSKAESLFFCRAIGFYLHEILLSLDKLTSNNSALQNPKLVDIIIKGIFCNYRFFKEYVKAGSRQQIIDLLQKKLLNNNFFKTQFDNIIKNAETIFHSSYGTVHQHVGGKFEPVNPCRVKQHLQFVYDALYE